VSAAELAVVAALWLVVAWRIPSLRQGLLQRALWAAVAGLAVSMTVRLDPVSELIDQSTGVPALATLIKHLAGIAAVASVFDTVVIAQQPHRRPFGPRHLISVTAAVAMCALFAAMPREDSTDFTDHALGRPLPTAYQLVFEVYLGVTMAMAAALFRAASRPAAGLLRRGYLTLALGTAIGAGYALMRTAYLLIRLGTDAPAADHAVLAVTDALKYAAILMIAAGLALPALRAFREYRTLRRLDPLWRAVTAATPDIVLNTTPVTRRLLLVSPQRRLLLLRRAVELRDAMLVLRAHVPMGVRRQARAALVAAGFDGPLDAAVEAVWLHMALSAVSRGVVLADQPLDHIADPDLDRDLRRLEGIALVYRAPEVLHAAVLLTSPAGSFPGGLFPSGSGLWA